MLGSIPFNLDRDGTVSLPDEQYFLPIFSEKLLMRWYVRFVSSELPYDIPGTNHSFFLERNDDGSVHTVHETWQSEGGGRRCEGSAKVAREEVTYPSLLEFVRAKGGPDILHRVARYVGQKHLPSLKAHRCSTWFDGRSAICPCFDKEIQHLNECLERRAFDAL